jgi:hypothetical protein
MGRDRHAATDQLAASEQQVCNDTVEKLKADRLEKNKPSRQCRYMKNSASSSV